MYTEQKITKKANAVSTATWATFWTGYCALGMFITLFLDNRGLSYTQIGMTAAAAALVSVILQLLISDFSDRHNLIPLKRIIAVILIIGIIMSASLMLLPSSVAFVMIAMVISTAGMRSISSLLNALVMQLKNAGIPISFGIPRGVGSLAFAVSAWLLGYLIDKSSPEIILPAHIIFGTLAMVSVLLMPRPDRIPSGLQYATPAADAGNMRSITTMIRTNPTLLFLMLAMIATFSGQNITFIFLIKIIQNTGGTSADLGTALMIQSGVELPAMFLSVWLLKKFGSKKLLILSFTAFFLKLLAISLAPTTQYVFLAMLIGMFGLGIFIFASVYFVNEIVRESEKVRGQALGGIIDGISSVLGSLMGGWVIDNWGLQTLLGISTGLCLVGLILMLVASWFHKRDFQVHVSERKFR